MGVEANITKVSFLMLQKKTEKLRPMLSKNIVNGYHPWRNAVITQDIPIDAQKISIPIFSPIPS